VDSKDSSADNNKATEASRVSLEDSSKVATEDPSRAAMEDSNREDTAAAAKLQLTTSSREAPVASGNRAKRLSLGFAVVPSLRCSSISKMH